MADTLITDRAMQAKPGAVDRWIVEGGSRGAGRLVGRITPSGERRFYFRYTGPEGQVRLSVGSYDPSGNGIGAFTVAQARSRALEWSLLYRSGVRDLRGYFAQLTTDAKQADSDSRAAGEAARRETIQREAEAALQRERRISVRVLFGRWRSVALQPRLRADGKRSGRKDGGQYTADQFERYIFPKLGDHAAADVRKADLMEILDSVKADGKLRTCNVLLSDLKQMFAFALVREVIERNPIDGVTKSDAGGTDAMRERVLATNEITALAGILIKARLHLRSEAAIWLLLATGARVGELMGAVWTHQALDLSALAALPSAEAVKVGVVDTAARSWYIPTTKNEREHTIHLSQFAIRQIEKLHALREVRIDETGREVLVPWLFPNTAGTGPVNVKSFGKQLADRQVEPVKRLKGRSTKTESLSLPGGRWTAHDLRRTAGTLMASLGVSGDVIDECLNHVIESRVRRTYVRDRRPADQARAFDALGSRLHELVSRGPATSNVEQGET